MFRFALRRLVSSLITALLTATLVYLALLALPGNPMESILGLGRGNEEALARQIGLARTPLATYFDWLERLLRGNLGTSLLYGEPVSRLIIDRLPITLPLIGEAILLSLLISLPLGLGAALSYGSFWDLLLTGFSQLGTLLPSFWLGLLLLLFFGLRLHWFPVSGFAGWNNGLAPALGSLFLPSLSLGLSEAAPLARQVRSGVLEAMRSEYVRTARAKGVSPLKVLLYHALRNALLPIITLIGLEVPQLLAGSLILEQVFALPGLGSLAFSALQGHDYPLAQGVTLVYTLMTLLTSYLVDLAYAWIDPRITYA